MAQILQSLLLLSFLLTIGNALRLDLIPRFSPRSPHYPGNLTKSQLAQRLLHLSNSHISRLKPRRSSINATTIRPPMFESNSANLVSVSIGTDQGYQSYYLDMDTGSGLTWTQCLPCDPCFTQADPIFDPSLSPSFQFLACDDPICVPPFFRCQNGQCTFDITYGDRSSVRGVVSRETFTFQSTTGQSESIPGLAFGCTHWSSGLTYYDGEPAGILGMDHSPESFITQLTVPTGGRFSYCLLPFGVEGPNFLRFGDDIVMNGPVHRTPFLVYEDNSRYYLDLIDISIDMERLNIPAEVFRRQPDGSSGCIIDSGNSISRLIPKAYEAVKTALALHFEYFAVIPVDGREYNLGFDICYAKPSDFDNFPSMTLHLQGADMQVEWEQMFFIDEEQGVFCVMLTPYNEVTIIGSYQQSNTRFTYDIVNKELLFVPEDCAQHP